MIVIRQCDLKAKFFSRQFKCRALKALYLSSYCPIRKIHRLSDSDQTPQGA